MLTLLLTIFILVDGKRFLVKTLDNESIKELITNETRKSNRGIVCPTLPVFSSHQVLGISSTSSTNNHLQNGVRNGKSVSDSLEELISDTLEAVESDNIRSYLKTITSAPHIAASEQDSFLTKWIADKWKEFGFDHVNLEQYNFLLSFPDHENPNKIYLKDDQGRVQFTSKHKEDVLRAEDEHPDFIHAFNAFAPAGNVTGDLVYVNYARVEDISRLEELGVDLTGKIAIARYGKLFRGNKVKHCQDAGAIGVIMYTDPEQVAPNGTDHDSVYPNTIFLPPSGIQRGNVITTKGDPLSPTWSSVPGAYRLSVDEAIEKYLPKIPSQPIGYGDAEQLLAIMGGDQVPEEWRGGIPGLQYRLGPGCNSEHRGWRVNLVVNNKLRDTSDNDIVGIIRGSHEPDRYVIIGNHRDAWGYGAMDPSSGTAPLMEIARVLGERVRAGWRPRRSIVMVSWAAEEMGLMGSWEWSMDKIHKLTHRAVGHINMDICVSGDILSTATSPSLKPVMLNAMKGIISPRDDMMTIHEYLQEHHDSDDLSDTVKILGSGSDHTAFAFYAGVPSVFYGYKRDGGYPAYHTGFETFYLMDKLVDPGFKSSKACTQLGLHMALQLSEAPVLPYSLTHMISVIEGAITELKNTTFVTLRERGASEILDVTLEAFQKFKAAAEVFSSCQNGQLNDDLSVRMLNDKLMLLERVFLLPQGLPDRLNVRNAMFSPSKQNSYVGTSFPGVRDLMQDFDKREENEQNAVIKRVKKHLSEIMTVFKQAKDWLEDDHI